MLDLEGGLKARLLHSGACVRGHKGELEGEFASLGHARAKSQGGYLKARLLHSGARVQSREARGEFEGASAPLGRTRAKQQQGGTPDALARHGRAQVKQTRL